MSAPPTYRPADGYVTLVVQPKDVQLGDITDHLTGFLRVREIVQRISVWTVGGHGPNDWTRVPMNDTDPPPLVRHVAGWSKLRVYRRVKPGLRVPGHTKTVTSHNPRVRGCYTHVDGWNAACSCGWKSETVHGSQGRAREALIPHHAEILTQQTQDAVPNLVRIQALEEHLGDRLPWTWRNGIAEADLAGLPETEQRARLDLWAQAVGGAVGPRWNGQVLGVFSETDGVATNGIEIRTDIPAPRLTVPNPSDEEIS
jgi:hypothetical protein